MSERTAPRPGGRATDHADAQRSDARGARHFKDEKSDTRRSGIGREAAGKPAPRKTDKTKADQTKTDGVRGERAELVRGKGRRPEPAIKTRREEALEERAQRDGKGRRPVADAPVNGTAALRVDEVVAEPVLVTGEVPAPRLRVAPPAPISAPRAPFVASVIGVVVVGVLGILLINTKTNENSFQIADLQKQGAALDNQQQDLENQLVAASSIGNLDAAARRLGLVKADNPAVFRLPDGKIIGIPKPANGRPAVTAQDAKTPGSSDAGAGKVAPVSPTNVSGANVSPTNVSETNVSETNVGGTNVGGTNVGGTNVGGTNVGGTNVGGANGTDSGGTANGATVSDGQTQSGTGQ
ncbi:hypothetical protein Ate02nite_39240 [Paractinoplanes tereljensis]|uniref:Cell division protein FtsL n=1 Tax=Paractinoplanes tereljensis TaxID=571912 RepID=A0A919NNJ3_9ACTN|nr:pentapeptide repeat-containing protein [Actinoplanes tereljensis]GIF21194.1 hypothetical protein Ate02nite_39240 [Actinoplanes tereljensis]